MLPEKLLRALGLAWLGACMGLYAALGAAAAFSRLIVFGDSLSDPGNGFTLLGTQSVPPYDTVDMFLVPSAPNAGGATISAMARPGSSSAAGP